MKNTEILKNKFEEIKKTGFHKSINNYKNSGGTTLEYLLGSTGGNFNIPDYDGIEIKAIRKVSNRHIDLFSSSPDGSIVNGIKWLSENFGYPDKIYRNINVFKGNVFANRVNNIGSKFLFKIKICKESKRFYLQVLDYEYNLISEDIYWDFDTIQEKLYRKNNILAIFQFVRKWESGNIYYKYTNMNIYKIKNFDDFIYCLEKGYIYFVFKTGVFKTNKYKGQFKDHGTSLRICVDNLEKLFNKVH